MTEKAACWFFHSGEWVADETVIEWVRGPSGARPFHPAKRICTDCGREQTGLVRAEGQGLVG